MTYRLYFFLDGHIRKAEDLLDCANDDAARGIATARLADADKFNAVEVWDRWRKVCALPSEIRSARMPSASVRQKGSPGGEIERRFVVKENVAHFQRLLARETQEQGRDPLLRMLLAAQRELALLDAEIAGAYSHVLPEIAGHGGWPQSSIAKQFQREFEKSALCYVVIDPRPGLHIVDINDAYGRATMTERARIAGLRLFEVFPDNPHDPDANGVNNVYTSLRMAAESLKPHAMAIQRYDIRGPAGHFLERYWRPFTTPIVDDKARLTYLLHRVEDVTSEVLSRRETPQA